MEIATVSIQDVLQLRMQPKVQVVDMRPPFSYCGGRIPGALNLPGAAIAAQAGQLPPDFKLIFVDDDGGKAMQAAQAAAGAGFTDICIMEGGFDAWVAADLPVETISDGLMPSPPAPPTA